MPGGSIRKRASSAVALTLTAAAIVAVAFGASPAGSARKAHLSSTAQVGDHSATPRPAEDATQAPPAVGHPAKTDTGNAASAPKEEIPGAPVPELSPRGDPHPEVRSEVTLGAATEPEKQCGRALAAVESAGLVLPEGTAFRCPGNTETFPGDRQHSGVACWGKRQFCPGESYIAVNPEATAAGDQHLHYVIAHEICHIQAYLRGELGGTEPAADACAARAGFPRP